MSSVMPAGQVVERSASLRIICVGVSSVKESVLQIERGIKLMLIPRSARAKQTSNSGKSHGMRNLPGSSNFSDNFFKITAEQFLFTGVALEQQQTHQLELKSGPPEVGCFWYSVVPYPLSPQAPVPPLWGEKKKEEE
nr:hypothetical protein [Tanacetum cinerariifolium]